MVFIKCSSGHFAAGLSRKKKETQTITYFDFSIPPKIWTFVPIFSWEVEINNEEKSTIACWDSNPNPHNLNCNPLTQELPPNALMCAFE